MEFNFNLQLLTVPIDVVASLAGGTSYNGGSSKQDRERWKEESRHRANYTLVTGT